MLKTSDWRLDKKAEKSFQETREHSKEVWFYNKLRKIQNIELTQNRNEEIKHFFGQTTKCTFSKRLINLITWGYSLAQRHMKR